MSDRDEAATLAALTDWNDRLTAALGIEGVNTDIDAVLALAGTVAHAIMRPAAPLTTYLVGYAAGVAAASSGPTSAGFTSAGPASPASASPRFTNAGPASPRFTNAGFTSAAQIATALAKSAER